MALASELIKDLVDLVAEHGDKEIIFQLQNGHLLKGDFAVSLDEDEARFVSGELKVSSEDVFPGEDVFMIDIHVPLQSSVIEADRKLSAARQKPDGDDWCNCQAIIGTWNYPGPWHPVGNAGGQCAKSPE